MNLQIASSMIGQMMITGAANGNTNNGSVSSDNAKKIAFAMSEKKINVSLNAFVSSASA